MKERPILFNGAMVRALLAGTKTQTRRIFKAKNGGLWPRENDRPGMAQILRSCPYGQPGDRLWVRESFAHHVHAMGSDRDEDGPFVYAATDHPYLRIDDRWKPSLHMPQWASRITLEVTGVRVERLQDISQSDAKAEGAPPSHPSIDSVSRQFGYADFSRSWYAQLWEQINGPGSWQENPWVWVVEFRRLDKAGAA